MTIVLAVRSGFSLAETTLALGVASVCLAAILALLPAGSQTERHALQESLATDILGIVAEDLRIASAEARPGETTASRNFGIGLPGDPISNPVTSTLFFTGDGQFSSSATPTSRCRLTIRFLPNVEFRHVTLVHLKMTWPADASPENAPATMETFLSLDRN